MAVGTSRLVFDEEQKMLRKTALQFVRDNAPVARLRELRDTHDAQGYSKALWSKMAELGWLGLALPEEYDGFDLGFVELCCVLEAAGRHLMPEPFVSTLLLGAQALLLGGTREQKAMWLPRVAAGDAVIGVAHEERGTRGDFRRASTVASPAGSDFVLNGTKVQVLDGHVADVLLVSATTTEKASGVPRISLFLVDPTQAGVGIARQFRVDTHNAAAVTLTDVQVSQAAMVGELHAGAGLLEQVLDRALVGVAAEALGAAQQAFEDTVGYLKERVQFGVPIGSFQALQHRASRLFIELALARATVWAAASAVDEGSPELSKAATLAKETSVSAFVAVAKEAIQMHGGIGMTDEHNIGLYIKRAQALQSTFGDSPYQHGRWASLNGY